MKYRFTAACVAAALLCPSLSSATGIPVVDALGNLERVNEWTQHLDQWKNTVQHYQNQLDAYKKQLATATGVRDVQAFFSEAKSLTNDLKNLQQNGISLNDLLTNPSGSYSNTLDNLYNKYKMFDICGKASSTDTCKQEVINKAVALEDTADVQQKISSTVSDISTLSSRVQSSADSKESQDLANAITTKSVQLNALTTQWEMNVKQAELRDKMLTSQRQFENRKKQLKAPVADLNNL
ncbi:Minor pilin of type IV secretion complex (VirB5) [Erwinia typographi]|uniref:Minor pilin of type IV secretion complex (VirB5) n=1 Tax=Erwinia typographi TaxID=371042 RepID=A0A0A3YNX9_9GAMM|nr:type IV secretion system protein [Erwinia typographi]KGT87016.1 Minor pilin of type IV secretion complex (VirB5) [Erwinia typographi]